MKRKILFLLGVCIILSFSAQAQRVRSEIVQIKKSNTAFIPLPFEAKSFSSNNQSLQIHGFERDNSNPDLIITGRIFPAFRHSEWAMNDIELFRRRNRPDDILFSQPIELTVNDKDGNVIYYRVFNYFGFAREGDASPRRYLDTDVSIFNTLSEHLSLLFSSSYEPEFRTRLHYIHRSENHDDLNKAYKLAYDAVDLYNDGNEVQAVGMFEEAIDIWKEALKEANLDDRRSRINKNIAEGIYRNLMQTLAIVGRYDEAAAIIEESKEAMGVMFHVRISMHEYNKRRMELMTKGAQEDLNAFYHFELNSEQKPMLRGENTFLPTGNAAISNYLVGTWRFYAVNSDMLPVSADGFDVFDRAANLPADESIELLHLHPNGSKINQEGSWERTTRSNLDDSMPFWKVFNGPDGHTYLLFAYELEDFDDISGNMMQMDMHRIFHVCENRLILMSPNFDPNSDVTRSYVHLQRVGRLMD